MTYWNGGISKAHHNYYIARVPRPDAKSLVRRFKGVMASVEASKWQSREGSRIWGDMWDAIKKQGPSVAVIRKRKTSKASKHLLIRPGVVLRQVRDIPLDRAGLFVVNGRIIDEDGLVKRRIKHVSYGTESSRYKTRVEAEEQANKVRDELESNYNKAVDTTPLLK